MWRTRPSSQWKAARNRASRRLCDLSAMLAPLRGGKAGRAARLGAVPVGVVDERTVLQLREFWQQFLGQEKKSPGPKTGVPRSLRAQPPP